MPAAEVLDLSYLANPDAPRLERLGAQLHRRLAGGDVTADSPYTREEVMLALEEYRGFKQAEVNRLNFDRLQKYAVDAAEFARKQYYEDFEAIYKLGGTADQWTRSFNLAVLQDQDRGLPYCLLPEQFVNIARYQNLPGEEGIRGVEYIQWSKNVAEPGMFPGFVPFPNGAARQFGGLYRGGLQGNYGYFRDSDANSTAADRLYIFKDFATRGIADKQLRITLIIRPTRDGLPQPGLLADVSDMDMVMGAEAILLRRGPEDRVSDNVPPPPVQTA